MFKLSPKPPNKSPCLVNEFESESTMNITPNLQQWLLQGERGISSETMAEVFAGFPTGTLTGHHWLTNHPHDPSDFRRCLQLLEQCPEFEPNLDQLKALSPVWARMIENWSKMRDLYKQEYQTGKAPKLYALMYELIYKKPLKQA